MLTLSHLDAALLVVGHLVVERGHQICRESWCDRGQCLAFARRSGGPERLEHQ